MSRSLTIKNTDKTTVQKLFESSDSSLATTKLDTPNINPSHPNNKRGPLTIAAAGTYTTGKENSEGRFVVVGSSSWVANFFSRSTATATCDERDELAFLGRGFDFHPAETPRKTARST